ncbi:MAG: peroxiredoxin [Pseudomonadota bacterium]
MTNLLDVDWSTIPAPEDDGGADHLKGLVVPDVVLMASDGREVSLAQLEGRTVVYAYPMTGTPGTPLPDGWDMIPGARGCTPQSCAFRDHDAELKALGVRQLFGLSTQTSVAQREAAERLHLPFALLSDRDCALADAMRLPTFIVDAQRMIKRVTLVIDDGRVAHAFYPVFPPDEAAATVVRWLRDA